MKYASKSAVVAFFIAFLSNKTYNIFLHRGCQKASCIKLVKKQHLERLAGIVKKGLVASLEYCR